MAAPREAALPAALGAGAVTRRRRVASEAALVRAAQGGSAEAMEELFRRHWPAAHRAAWLVVHDAAAAEDAAQEARARAPASSRSLRSRAGSAARRSYGAGAAPRRRSGGPWDRGAVGSASRSDRRAASRPTVRGATSAGGQRSEGDDPGARECRPSRGTFALYYTANVPFAMRTRSTPKQPHEASPSSLPPDHAPLARFDRAPRTGVAASRPTGRHAIEPATRATVASLGVHERRRPVPVRLRRLLRA